MSNFSFFFSPESAKVVRHNLTHEQIRHQSMCVTANGPYLSPPPASL